jgi:predicted Fe-Mo cluster-binding NifX family protein
MKIAVSSTKNTLESPMDPRFGRAACFIVIDPDTMEFEAVDNGGSASSGGAGIAAAQLVTDKGVTAVITGNVGPNAMDVLKAAKIEIFRGIPNSVKENVLQFKKGALSRIDSTVPRHSGMNRGNR